MKTLDSACMLARSERYQGNHCQMRAVRTPTIVHQTTNTNTPGVSSSRTTSPPLGRNRVTFLFLSKLIQDFYSKVISYKNRILPYYTILHCFNKKKSPVRKFRYDFLMILIDVLLFKDPGSRKVPDPPGPDPQHCFSTEQAN